MEENNITTSTKVQKDRTSKGWKIAAIILAIALVGTVVTAFAFFASKNNNEDSIVSQQDIEKEERLETKPEDDTRYLTVNEWNMRFVIPDGFSELGYKISDDRLDFNGSLIQIDGNEFAFTSGIIVIEEGLIQYDRSLGLILRYKQGSTCEICEIDTSLKPIASNGGYDYYFVTRIGDHAEFYEEIVWYLLNRMALTAQFI